MLSGYETVGLVCRNKNLNHVQSLRRQVFMFLTCWAGGDSGWRHGSMGGPSPLPAKQGRCHEGQSWKDDSYWDGCCSGGRTGNEESGGFVQDRTVADQWDECLWRCPGCLSFGGTVEWLEKNDLLLSLKSPPEFGDSESLGHGGRWVGYPPHHGCWGGLSFLTEVLPRGTLGSNATNLLWQMGAGIWLPSGGLYIGPWLQTGIWHTLGITGLFPLRLRLYSSCLSSSPRLRPLFKLLQAWVQGLGGLFVYL